MAIPTDYIFTPGTCLKKDFFDLMISKLIAAGWTDVSSNATTDYIVLTSTGNTGDKALVLNLRKGSAATPANDVSTTGYCQFSFRFPSTYTPGTSGAAGTFVRPDVWRDIYIAPVGAGGQLAMDTTYNYKIYTDKSKIMFSIEFPPGTGYSPIFVYLGLPDSLYCTENANRGIVYAATTNFGFSIANVFIADTPAGMGSSPACYLQPTICTLAPKNPNNAGKYTVSDIYYGSAAEGVRGKLDGVLALPTSGILTADTITIGTHQYYVLNCHAAGTNAFLSTVVAIRTA